MITDEVIKEIYKKFSKPPKRREDLELGRFQKLLEANHSIRMDDMEVEIMDLEEFNPFRRFLIRSLTAVLEFDKMVAFVFKNHILFLGKEDDTMRVHIKPEKPRSFLGRLFGG